MRVVPIFPILITVALAGLISPGKQDNVNREDLITNDTIPGKTRSQPLKKFVPDDYPVTDEMFEGNYNSISSGDIVSNDKAWFRNNTLHQTLVIELYTDHHRLLIFHFKNADIPPDLVTRMELHSGNYPAGTKAKQKAFPGFIQQAHPLAQKYFRSNKGFKLGDSVEKAIKIYGRPDKISKQNDLEKYEWKYIGDTFYDPKKDKGKKIAQDSFGHQAIMFFRNKKLIGLILHNDIP